MHETELEGIGATGDPQALNAAIADIVRKARHDDRLDPATRADLAAIGDEAFRMRPHGHHLGGETLAALALVFAGTLTREAAKALWTRVIEPRLERRLGKVVQRSPEPGG